MSMEAEAWPHRALGAEGTWSVRHLSNCNTDTCGRASPSGKVTEIAVVVGLVAFYSTLKITQVTNGKVEACYLQ